MYLVFDTETTGLPAKKADPVRNYELWPRLVQIAWSLYDNEGPITAGNYYIKPEGFTIPEEVVKIHGITNEFAQAEGVPINEALIEFFLATNHADTLVAHNLEFDMGCVTAEMARLAKTKPALFLHISRLASMKPVCTKVASTDFCKLPNMYGKGYKWPKLEELYKTLFHESIAGAHNAVFDVEATNRCYVELVKKGVIT